MVVKENENIEMTSSEQPITVPPPAVSGHIDERLIISHIENINFKSYAGKQILGPFHKSFSSIVGPNGSGKSNVIDAMLFVFGYRSKKIRSKKVSLLIHNSENHQNIESCTVVVYFQKIIDLPGDEYTVVPNSQFNISRTARKDGSSDYYMNGKKSQFKEIGVVLRGCGIDLDHNRFLILQGEVEQISMMKPKAESEHDEGMLEYLEDIVGTNRFKEPIEASYKKVEDLNEKRGEKLNRAKAVEKEKDELEGAKNEATEFLAMENKMTKKNHLLYQKYIYDCQLVEDQSTEKRDQVKKQLDTLQEELKEYTEQKKEKGKEYKKISKLFDNLVKEQEEKKKVFAEYEKQDLKIREEFKHRKANHKKLEKNLDAERKKLNELHNVPSKSQEEIEKCTKSLEQLENQKIEEEEKLSEIMAGLKNETEGMQKEKEEKENDLMEKQKVVNDAKSKLDVASSQLEVYLSEYKKLKDQLEQAQENATKAKSVRDDNKKILIGLREDIPANKKELHKAEQELEVVTKELNEISVKIKKVRVKVEETRNAMHASQSRGAVIDAIMAEKKIGRIKGIHGRLGDLGAIDAKYDVAISTSCGYLDYIVCDTSEAASKCIEFLKKRNIGVASFIALDKIGWCKQSAREKIQTPENVKRLYDLVKVNDENFKTAFYFALKNTLVSDNLDQATRIAYPKAGKRWRVVTLKGDVIETSGTMSGGGSKPVKGRMGAQLAEEVNPKDVDKIEKDLSEDIEKSEELRERKSSLEDTIQKLKKQIKTTEHQIQKLEMEIQSLTVQEDEQKARANSLIAEVKRSKPDLKEEAKLQKEIESYEKVYKKAADAAIKIEKEVRNVHDKIMEIGKTKLSGQQAKLDSVNKIIDEVTQKKTKATVALKTADRNIKKSEEKVESLQKEVEENTESMKNIQEVELKQIEENATRILEECENGQNEMKEMQVKLQEVKVLFESTDKDEDCLRSKEIDLNHEFQKYDTIVKDNQNKILHWQNKLSNLIIHKIRQSSSSDTSQEENNTFVSLTPEEIQQLDSEAISYEVAVLTEKRDKIKPNMAAIEEYFKKEEAYLSRVKELEEVTEERDRKRKEHDDLRKQRLDEFMAGFGIITNKLKEMYQMITLGGDAELELVDSLDPFSEGIVFSVRPPKKSWKNISNLSGGEKTLSSLALVFALHHYKPTPLYVMDEIDAALDFKNVSIVANYIKERTRNAQFIIISLRNNMFELADRLVGIYKTDNCTKSVVVNPTLISPVNNKCREKLTKQLTRLTRMEKKQSLNVIYSFVVQRAKTY